MGKQKIIPQMRFTEFEGEWVNKKLGQIYKFKITNSLSRADLNYENGSVKNIHYGDIHTQYATLFDITKESVPYINHELNITKYSDENYCQEGDLIFADASEDYNDIGKCIEIVNLNNEKVQSGLHTLLARPEKSIMAIGFAGYLMKSGNVKLQIQREAQGTKVLSITSGRLSKIELIFPALPEQQKIASFFTAIDQKISQLKRKKTLLEQYKKGVMQKIFSQKIRFRDDNGQEFPKWEKKRLGSILNERNIQVPKSDEYPLMAFVANKGVAQKGERYNREFLVNDGDNKKYKQTEYGDFIYSSNNLETGSIGLNSFGSASISPVYSIFQIDESCNPQFLGCYFVRKSFINKMTSYRQGVVYGQWRIHESDFLKIEEWIPSTTEQTKIANFLSAIDDKINHTQKQVEKAEVWKKGLMQQMFC